MCPSPLPIQGYHISEPTIIKIEIEDSPEPDILEDSTQSAGPLEQQPVTTASRQTVIDPKDPEGFLRRCSGQNKKTRARCSQVIGRNSSNSLKAHSTFLPTCKTHQDQKSFAGWCQFRQDDGERCGRLFRWTPPYFELCEDHQGHPDTPCYLMKLPLELRHEVFRYLLPTESINSSIVPNHRDNAGLHPLPMCMPTWPTTSHSTNANAGPSRRPCRRTSGGVDAVGQSEFNNKRFPFSLIDLLLVSRQFYEEVKDLLYSTAVFTVDIRRDGTYMCGRRVLEPTRPDGSSHAPTSALQQMGKRFVSTFDFKAVKNYNIHILVEDWSLAGHESWDEEVEIYDIRDYIGVTVSGILALARNLCRLNVRIGFAGFKWTQEELLKNMKSLAEPFERLRNVRQPRLCGVFDGFRDRNYMTTISAHSHQNTPYRPNRDLCSVPPLTTDTFLLCPSNTGFELYRAKWEKWVAHTASTSLCQKPPIRAMFTEFKKFYTKLMPIVPEVTFRHGRHAFLHRARVAREHENVEELRHLRNELVQYWCLYLEREEEKKTDMDKQLSSMLETDIYPSQEPENWSRRPSSSSSSPESPTALDAGKMAAEGIPMIQNPQGNMGTFGMRRMMNIPTPHNPQIIRYGMVQQPVELQAMQPQLAMNARQTAHNVALVKQRQRQLLLQQLQQERMGGQPSHYHSHFTSVQGGQIQHQHQLDAAQAHAASQQPFMPTKLSSTMQGTGSVSPIRIDADKTTTEGLPMHANLQVRASQTAEFPPLPQVQAQQHAQMMAMQHQLSQIMNQSNRFSNLGMLMDRSDLSTNWDSYENLMKASESAASASSSKQTSSSRSTYMSNDNPSSPDSNSSPLSSNAPHAGENVSEAEINIVSPATDITEYFAEPSIRSFEYDEDVESGPPMKKRRLVKEEDIEMVGGFGTSYEGKGKGKAVELDVDSKSTWVKW